MKRAKLLMTLCFAILLSTSLFTQAGLVAHWSFDEITNNQFKDHVTNEVAGTVYGALTVPGPVGNALEFNGLDDYARIMGDGQSPPETISKLSKGTISLWFKVENIPLSFGIRPIFYYGRENACSFFDAANEGMIIEIGHSPIHNGSRRLYNTAWTNGCTFPSFCYDSWNPIFEGIWYHYVAVVGDDFNTGYLNGQMMTDRNYNFGDPQTHEFFSDARSHENLWIGRGYWDSEDMFFDGAIDEIKVFDRPLSAEEVQILYQEGDIVSGFRNNMVKIKLTVYPNPVNNVLNIKFTEKINNKLTFIILDSDGKKVYQTQFNAGTKSARVNLKGFQKGSYVYTISNHEDILRAELLIIQ